MFKGSIVALITPFTQEKEIDYPALEKLVEWHLEEGTDAIVICGTTGEAPTLSPEERLELIKRVSEQCKGKIPLIAGTGTYDTRTSVRLTEQAKSLGVDACLVTVPYYNRPTPEGCYLHYQAIDAVGVPLLIYHHPGRTGVKLPIASMVQIASLPSVVGIKDGSGDLEYGVEVMRHTSVPLLAGDDTLTLALMSHGAQGVISIIANLIPAKWRELCTALLQGDLATARHLNDHYHTLCRSMVLETNPQCIKYALGVLGKCSPLLRLPLIQPQERTQRLIEEAMREVSL